MKNYENIKITSTKEISKEFTDIYAMNFPNFLLESLLKNCIQISYDHRYYDHEKEKVKSLLLSACYTKSNIPMVQTITDQFPSLQNSIFEHLEKYKDELQDTWFQDSRHCLKIDGTKYAMSYQIALYFKNEEDKNFVLKNILLPLRLSY